jgi:formamidopyrimidine-DNA glycosylase
MKFHIGDNVVYTGEGCSRGEVVTVVEVRKRWLVVKDKAGYCCTVLKSQCLTMAEAKEQALNPKVTVKAGAGDRKHMGDNGRWIDKYGNGDLYCSECGAVMEKHEHINHNLYFCYHCGAKMDGGKENV